MIDLPKIPKVTFDPNGVLEAVVPMLVDSMFNDPGYLLRHPRFCPIESDVAVLVWQDTEQRIVQIDVRRGSVPGELQQAVTLPVRWTDIDPDPTAPSYRVRRWLPSMWSTALAAAHLMPDVPHTDAYQVRITAALYEPEGDRDASAVA